MTKSEYFRKCDFNNRKLIDKINYCLYILDNPFNKLPDKTDDECTIRCDKDGTPNPDGKYTRPNRELAEANLQFLKEFPKFEEIVTSLRENKFDINKVFSEITLRQREKNLNELISKKD
jgi:hypothetical protein